MPKFSPVSLERLETCDPRLRRLLTKVIERGFDCMIICGHRGQTTQDRLYEEGKTKLRWPQSKHNQKPSLAVDAAPYPIDWNDKERFYYFGGFVRATAEGMGIPIRWGGDWDGDFSVHDQTFMDLVHFEIDE